ncbi:MAG: sulfate transporter CysZ, partial [Chromatiaceae bacterium]
MVVNPVSGPAYLLEGMRLIARPGLRRFVAIPLAINILVFAAALYWGISRFEGLIAWLHSLLPTLPDWLAWLERGLDWILWPLFVLLAVVLVFQGFTLIANLIAAPFNGLLAEKIANHLQGGSPDSAAGMGQVLTTLIPALLDEVRKLLYALLWAIPFFVLSLVLPLIGPLLWFLFSAWILALEYLDYPMGNQGLGAREIRRRLRGRPVLSLGFGAATVVLTMIPLVNFIAMPSAVAGATALW